MNCCDDCYTNYTTDDYPAQQCFDACLNLSCVCHKNTRWHPDGITCTNTCGYQEPYGFVPEAGCKVHDIQDVIAMSESTPEEWESELRNYTGHTFSTDQIAEVKRIVALARTGEEKKWEDTVKRSIKLNDEYLKEIESSNAHIRLQTLQEERNRIDKEITEQFKYASEHDNYDMRGVDWAKIIHGTAKLSALIEQEK